MWSSDKIEISFTSEIEIEIDLERFDASPIDPVFDHSNFEGKFEKPAICLHQYLQLCRFKSCCLVGNIKWLLARKRIIQLVRY